MTLISVRKNLFREINIKELYEVSDFDFRLQYSFIKFDEILESIGITKKIIGQYDRAIMEFLIFLELINIKIDEVIESDLELYREILLRRSNNKRSANTKVTRIKAYLYVYHKINEHTSMKRDLSTKGIEKEITQILSE